MPLSNVFRHSFSNPFHISPRKNRHAHARSGSTAGSPTSIVIVSVGGKSNSNNSAADFTPLPSTLGRSDSRKSNNLKGKGKDNEDGSPGRKGSRATSKSSHSSLSTCHLERLDPDTIPRSSSPSSGMISQLQLSKAPLSLQEQHVSTLTSPTSTSFSPSPLSPHICMPSSPSAPSTPFETNSSRLLSASPEPLTPAVPTSPATSGTIRSPRSRFGSLFTFSKARQDSGERILSDQEVNVVTMGKDKVDPALLKKKRLSTGSLQIPIGAFLSSTFRNKQQGAQQKQAQPEQLQAVQGQDHQQDQTQQQQQPPQRKKRRGLLPKLPKLDTRPRIITSRSGSKKQKQAVAGYGDSSSIQVVPPANVTHDPANADAPEPESDWVVVPGSTATARSGGGSSHNKSSTRKAPSRLLSPFYLPRQIRTGPGSHSAQNLDPNVRLPPPMASSAGERNDTSTSNGSQAGQQFVDVYPAFQFEWHPDSQVFYDDRWDRASVRTVDTEIILLADDPNFPGYPERNDYWQQHCRIRERRWKHQIQKHKQQQMTEARSPKKWMNGAKADPVTGLVEDDSGSLLEEEDYDDDDEGRITDQEGPLSDRLRDVTDLLNSLPERTAHRNRQTTAPQNSQQNRFRQQRRVRYTTYSAYVAAMQVKSKNRTDHKRSLDVAAMASPAAGSDTDKLMTDVRALRERSMSQSASVKETADRFGGAVMGGAPIADPRMASLPEINLGQRRYAYRRDGTNLGSDDESEDQYEAGDRVHHMSSFASLQRQRQPDSGILFVAAAATTAEVYPSLVHDSRQQLLNRSGKSSATSSNKMMMNGFSSSHDQNHMNTSTANWIFEDGYDEAMIGCLVASYFDKRFLEEHTLLGSGAGKSDLDGDNGSGGNQSGDKMVGNGFMVLQSSFGDQGSLDAHNGPEKDPSGSSNSRPSDSAADRNNNDDINSNKNNYDNSKDSSKKDLCLSRPGQYASHNHIMPLEQLLELEEQERQRRRRVLLEQQELDRQKKLEKEKEQQLQLSIYPSDHAALDAKPSISTSTSTATPPSLPASSTSQSNPSLHSSSQTSGGAGDSGSGSSSGNSDTFLADPSTATSVLDTAVSSQQPADSVTTSPQNSQTAPKGSGYMLLVLDRGRCQYFENGTRKRGPQWDQYEEGEDEDTYIGHNATEVIEEGEEEIDEEDLAWMEQQRLRQEISPNLKRAPQKGKSVDDSSRVHPFGNSEKGVAGRERVSSQEVDPLGSLAVIDSPLSPRFANVLSESPTVSANSSQVFPSPQPSRPSTPSSTNALAPSRTQSLVVTSSTTAAHINPPARASTNGLSTLSRIRAVKSRASLSYSVLPTLSTSSHASSSMLPTAMAISSASTSTTTLHSSAPSTLLNNPSLGHYGSGSMTPGGSTLHSGGGTTPATPSSPLAEPTVHMSTSSSSMLLPGRKLSWSGLPNQPSPSSASALLLDALTKPPLLALQNGTLSKNVKNDPAQRLKQQWDQKVRSQSVMFMSPSAMAARSRSMLLSSPPMTTSGDKQQHDQRQRRQGTSSEGDLETQVETEADQEMEEELRQLLDDATHDNDKHQHSKKVTAARRARRAMSMVELSVSTTASQYKAAVSATRQRFKAEASTSTSTVDILQSEGMYQWDEFFDV